MASSTPIGGARTLLVSIVTVSLAASGAVALVTMPAAATPSEPVAESSAVTATARAGAKIHWDTCRAGVPDRAKCGHLNVLADPLRPGLGKQRVGFELYRRSDRSTPAIGTERVITTPKLR